ncbi:UNVERIFIED_CONTAM: hypothetical protein H355_008581 [Colinus virginianus]|nr:hypothetical protein H355_008581 [Colinus virginianus]
MNNRSSRSHAVFTITLQQRWSHLSREEGNGQQQQEDENIVENSYSRASRSAAVPPRAGEVAKDSRDFRKREETGTARRQAATLAHGLPAEGPSPAVAVAAASERRGAAASTTLQQQVVATDEGGAEVQLTAVPAGEGTAGNAEAGKAGTATSEAKGGLRKRAPTAATGRTENAITSKIHFVDLAGSERVKRAQVDGQRLREGIAVNVGLLALSNVICALAAKKETVHRAGTSSPEAAVQSGRTDQMTFYSPSRCSRAATYAASGDGRTRVAVAGEETAGESVNAEAAAEVSQARGRRHYGVRSEGAETAEDSDGEASLKIPCSSGSHADWEGPCPKAGSREYKKGMVRVLPSDGANAVLRLAYRSLSDSSALADTFLSLHAARSAATGERGRERVSRKEVSRSLQAPLALEKSSSSPFPLARGAGGRGGPQRQHVPYRASKLTRILQDSLGGDRKTLMLVCVSPAAADCRETYRSMHYASRTMCIRNSPVVQQDPTAMLIQNLRRQVLLLQRQAATASEGAAAGDAVGWRRRCVRAEAAAAAAAEEVRLLRLRLQASQAQLKRLRKLEANREREGIVVSDMCQDEEEDGDEDEGELSEEMDGNPQPLWPQQSVAVEAPPARNESQCKQEQQQEGEVEEQAEEHAERGDQRKHHGENVLKNSKAKVGHQLQGEGDAKPREGQQKQKTRHRQPEQLQERYLVRVRQRPYEAHGGSRQQHQQQTEEQGGRQQEQHHQQSLQHSQEAPHDTYWERKKQHQPQRRQQPTGQQQQQQRREQHGQLQHGWKTQEEVKRKGEGQPGQEYDLQGNLQHGTQKHHESQGKVEDQQRQQTKKQGRWWRQGDHNERVKVHHFEENDQELLRDSEKSAEQQKQQRRRPQLRRTSLVAEFFAEDFDSSSSPRLQKQGEPQQRERAVLWENQEDEELGPKWKLMEPQLWTVPENNGRLIEAVMLQIEEDVERQQKPSVAPAEEEDDIPAPTLEVAKPESIVVPTPIVARSPPLSVVASRASRSSISGSSLRQHRNSVASSFSIRGPSSISVSTWSSKSTADTASVAGSNSSESNGNAICPPLTNLLLSCTQVGACGVVSSTDSESEPSPWTGNRRTPPHSSDSSHGSSDMSSKRRHHSHKRRESTTDHSDWRSSTMSPAHHIHIHTSPPHHIHIHSSQNHYGRGRYTDAHDGHLYSGSHCIIRSNPKSVADSDSRRGSTGFTTAFRKHPACTNVSNIQPNLMTQGVAAACADVTSTQPKLLTVGAAAAGMTSPRKYLRASSSSTISSVTSGHSRCVHRCNSKQCGASGACSDGGSFSSLPVWHEKDECGDGCLHVDCGVDYHSRNNEGDSSTVPMCCPDGDGRKTTLPGYPTGLKSTRT